MLIWATFLAWKCLPTLSWLLTSATIPGRRATPRQTRALERFSYTTSRRVTWGLEDMRLLERQKHWVVFLVLDHLEAEFVHTLYQTANRNQGSVFCSSWNISRIGSLFGWSFPHFWSHHEPETTCPPTIILDCLWNDTPIRGSSEKAAPRCPKFKYHAKIAAFQTVVDRKDSTSSNNYNALQTWQICLSAVRATLYCVAVSRTSYQPPSKSF